MFRGIAQAVAVTGMSLANLRSRIGPSIVAITGIAGVVMVTVGVASVVFGLAAVVQNNSDPNTIIVTRAAATGEMDSSVSLDELNIITETAGIARDENGLLLSPEVYLIIDMPRRTTGTSSNVPIRGVGPQAMAVRGNVRISEGRMLRPGLTEIVVGKGALAQFGGLELGATIQRGENVWQVVGILDADGGMPDGEIWADAKILQGAYRRGTGFQSVRARLTDQDQFALFRDTLSTNPQVSFKITTEQAFYDESTQFLRIFASVIGVLVGVLMALGAFFTAMNTMYSAVASRTREIATLRALGFGSGAVLTSVLVEAIVLGVIGGALGGIIAYVVFNGLSVATLNFQTFSQVAFSFAVTPKLLGIGIVFSLFMGLIGGALPAIRAARLPIATALREL